MSPVGKVIGVVHPVEVQNSVGSFTLSLFGVELELVLINQRQTKIFHIFVMNNTRTYTHTYGH